jgi:hypothetical protein
MDPLHRQGRNGETEIRGQKTAGRRQQAENNWALQDDSEKGRNGDAAIKAQG